MASLSDPAPLSNRNSKRSRSLRSIFNRLIAQPGFQAWSARMPFIAGKARRDGEAIFDIVAGFVNAQVLLALVELEIFERLLEGPRSPEALARETGLSDERMQTLLNAGAALDLLSFDRRARVRLARKGAALVGVPGLRAMIRHHGAFYADMADPVALLRGEADTELAHVWPYVFGDGGAADPEIKRIYSDLMADSQAMVAADTLRMVSFRGITRLMDVGGGSGAFALAVARAHPRVQLAVFDLPGVADQARARFECAKVSTKMDILEGSFRDSALPEGQDAISLIRVLYDHSDDTVLDLLRKCHAALPQGGQLIISEPMTGGGRPHRAGDVYFSFYCMAMQTGRARSADEISALCRKAGFAEITRPRAPRPFVTSALVARKTTS